MQQAPCSCFVELPTRLNRLGNKSFENVVLLISKNHSEHGSVCFGLFILSFVFLFVLFSYLFACFVCLFGGARTKTRQMCAMHHSRRLVLETRVQLSNTTQKLFHPWQTCSLASFPGSLLAHGELLHHFQLNAKGWCGLKSFCMFHSQIF